MNLHSHFAITWLCALLVAGAVRAEEVVFVDALDLSGVSCGWSTAKASRSVDGNPLRIGDREFKRGVGTHSNGRIKILLDGKASRFTALVGVDAEVREQRHKGSVVFRVLGDGRELWKSEVMSAEAKAVSVDVPLAGIKTLLLECGDSGDGNFYDHADWAEAAISYSGEKPEILSEKLQINMHGGSVFFQINDEKVYETWADPGKAAEAAMLPLQDKANAYPSQWDLPFNDYAIAMVQTDGKLSLDLHVADYELAKGNDGTTKLVFHLTDPAYPVKVDLCYIFHPECTVVERWAVVRNDGPGTVELGRADSAFLSLPSGEHWLTTFQGKWGREALISEQELHTGIVEIRSATGTRTSQMANPSFLVSTGHAARENEGEVWLGTLAWSGNWQLRFEKELRGKLNIHAGYDPTMARQRIPAGGTFETPHFIYTRSSHGKGEATRNIHRWARDFGIRDGHQARRILLNSWEGAYFDFNEKLIQKMITDAAKAGIELFVLDDGWFGNKYPRDNDRQGLGDWMVNERKLKGSIKALTDHAKKEGIDFGIWIEPEMVNPRSELYEKHPDWAISLPNRQHREVRQQLGLDLSNPLVQDYIFGVIDELLTQNPDISYIKWDCNRGISDPGSNSLPAEAQEELSVRYVRGYYAVLERITSKHPKVTFQICGSGGGRTDYGALKYQHEAWTSDNTDALERIRMQWSLNHIYPAIITAAHVTEVPNHQTKRVTPIKYRFDVAMTGRLGFELRPERVPEEDMKFSIKALDFYQKIRPIVQFGDLYRLRSPFEGNVASLLYAGTGEQSGQAVFFAFTQHKPSGEDCAPIQLNGLDPAKNYHVAEINLPDGAKPKVAQDGQTIRGEDLMKNGLSIQWNGDEFQSAVVLLRSE